METNKKQIKYPYLPEGREILYVPESNEFMKLAKDVSFRESTDRRFPTGAVMVRVSDNSVVSKEANKAPLTNSKLIYLHKKYCIRKILNVKSGQKYWLCPGCAAGDHHAEYRTSMSLIRNKKEYNKNYQYDLYLWGHWWACTDCWGAMLKVPIRNLYLMEGSEILFNEKEPNNICTHKFGDMKASE